MIYKQAYSRPLYKFNAHLNELTDKQGDYSFLNKEVKAEFKKQIVSKLLEKVTNLESRVQGDMNEHVFSTRGGGDGDTDMFSDNVSRYSGLMSRQVSGGSTGVGGVSRGLRNRISKLQAKAQGLRR